MIIAHCGAMGHRGIHVMENYLSNLFYIEGLWKQTPAFLSSEKKTIDAFLASSSDLHDLKSMNSRLVLFVRD